MKKKILFVITKSNFGGAQKYVFDLATNLPKDQFDITVAVGGAGILIEKLHAQNIRVLPIFSIARDVKLLSDIKTFFELWRMFKKEQPDVVHVNSAKAGGVGALAARLTGIPKIIFTAHGWAFNEERLSWQKLIIKFFSWITILLSHKTIAVSDAVKKDTYGWPFVQDKIVVIKNGISKPEFLTRKEARMHLFTRANKSIPDGAFVIGTIAELHKNKGLPYVIEALSILIPKKPSLYCLILGEGDELERLDTLIKHRGLQEHVFLLGFVDNAAQYLKAFDVFILPSITEGLALVLLEAGLAELPVIATAVGGIPEIIEDRKTGILVPPRDSDVLGSAINDLFESPTLREKFGTSLQEKVLRDFTLSRVINETTNVY